MLDKYPPRSAPEVNAPRRPVVAPPVGALPRSPEPTGPATDPPPGAPPAELIRLDRPFDVDEFSQMLGETSIRVNVPREDLPEVLRRVSDFMGFGIYIYAIAVRPAPSSLLKEFEVELQRVDFSQETGRWQPFVERDDPP